MKKNYLIALFALVCNFAMAQVQQTSYRGAFAPSPTAMWTTGWTNFDPQNADYGTSTVTIASDITSNTTWTAGNVYKLEGLITVRNNATLTIAPGTVIRSAQTASALLIARGAKLIANGTAALPIVFTSNRAIGERQRGDWGGIVMLGKARYNINNGVNFIEGITQTAITEFGGGTSPDNNDNSGILRFVRIEYAGYVFAPNNELNGLTMGAVGKGTVIENVQVSYSLDDSFEWFGGSVNCKNLVAFAGLDDDFDVDNGYSGVVQYGLSVKDPLAADVSTSEIFEVDNNNSNNGNGAPTDTVANTWADYTSGIFTNFTAIGPNKRPNGASTTVTPNALHNRALRLRKFSRVNVFNSIFVDHKTGVSIESLGSNAAYQDGDAKFKNNTISAATPFATVNTTTSTVPTTAQITATIAAANTLTTATTTTTGILAAPYNGTDATNYKLLNEAVTLTSTATGAIDYRPSSSTGADFTDSKLSGLLVVGDAPGVTATFEYCKGVVAPALTANLTATGVSLRWYAASATNVAPATTATFSTTAPVPATSATGTKYYFVREVDANGSLSNAAKITVTVVAAPAVALGSITSTVGGVAATAAVGIYIGTSTGLTYTVPASAEVGVVDYLWTVPTGANIVSGQSTNTIVVNYLNVPAGTLKVGNVSVQARNAALCGGAIKTLAITAVLPAAPAALVLNDGSTKTNATTGVVSNVAITSFAKYMGTTTPLTLVATPVVGAQSYVWELPTGVNITRESSVTSTVETKYYVLFPFVTPVSNPGLTVNTSGATVTNTNGSVYYAITTTTYSDGTSVATGRIKRNTRAATTGVGALPAITAFDIELTDKTFLQELTASPLTYSGVTINPAYPITSSTSATIAVNFNGVTSGNTFNYSTSAATPVSTNVMRIGVKTKNGVGVSVTANATATNPGTTSTAKLLTLKAVAPAAPSKIVMTNDAVSTTVAVTAVSNFVDTTTPFTVTATPSVIASSYTWELPFGVELVSGTLTGSSSNVITVKFKNVPAATTALAIGVKGVNGIGSSVTVNTAPNAASTAKLLKLTAAIPAAVSAVAGQVAGLCGESSYKYTITPSPLATSYVITAPAGSVVTSASNLGNTIETLTTTDLSFTVVYPAGFLASSSSVKTLGVAAKNGVGTSANKTLTLSSAMPAIATVTGGTTFQRSTPQSFGASVLGASTYTWVAANGAVITSGQGSNSVTVDFSAVSSTVTSTKLTVYATNACGLNTAVKSVTLASTTSGARIRQEAIAVSATEVYPNPVSSALNVDVTAANAGTVEVSVYSLDGTLVVNPKSIEVQEGANTVTENVSGLNSGIYILQIVNPSNGEVITKKLIKE